MPMDLVITHNLLVSKGGAEKVILEIAKRFEPMSIYVLKYDKEGTYAEFKDFNVVELGDVGGASLFGPAAAGRFYSLKIKDDYDVLNAHWPPSHWAARRNKRCVWYCHSPSRAVYDLYDYRKKSYPLPLKAGHYLFSKAYRLIDREVCPKIDYVFANSRNVQERISRYLKLDSEVLYPGVDCDRYVCKDYHNYFFLPGRIDPTKRIEYAISAFNNFKKKHPDFQLVIAGSLDKRFERYYQFLKSIFDGKIILNPEPEKMHELYSNCYGVLFAGMNEDFGITPLEAMASFKPVISVNEGGPKETVVDGKTGYLVDSASSMAQKMCYLADNPDVVQRMGKAGRKRVESNFTWKAFLDRFYEVSCNVADF